MPNTNIFLIPYFIDTPTHFIQCYQVLNLAITDMRAEMVLRAQNEAKVEIEEAIKQVSAAKLAEEITKDYKVGQVKL